MKSQHKAESLKNNVNIQHCNILCTGLFNEWTS